MNTKGKPADYIPQLSCYGAEHWGVALCTTDGQRYSVGHSTTPFTLQAISQVIVVTQLLLKIKGFSHLKSEEKKTAHFQKLAINKKSTIFVLSSRNLDKIIPSRGNNFHQSFMSIGQELWIFY